MKKENKAHAIYNTGGHYGGEWSYKLVEDVESHTCGVAMILRGAIVGRAYRDWRVIGPFQTEKDAREEMNKRNHKRSESIRAD